MSLWKIALNKKKILNHNSPIPPPKTNPQQQFPNPLPKIKSNKQHKIKCKNKIYMLYKTNIKHLNLDKYKSGPIVNWFTNV